MPDVAKLRGNACQEFLKMVIKPNWQQRLYDIAKEAIEHNRYADNYRPAYEKMRDIGIENYSIDEWMLHLLPKWFVFALALCPFKNKQRMH